MRSKEIYWQKVRLFSVSKKYVVFFFFFLKRLGELKRQCLEKEERFQNIAGLSTMKTNLEYLKHEMAWAVVILLNYLFTHICNMQNILDYSRSYM